MCLFIIKLTIYSIFIFPYQFLLGKIIEPKRDIDLNSIHVLFSWDQEIDNKYFIIEIDTTFNSSIPMVFDSISSTCFIGKKYFQWDKNYYWSLISVDNFGNCSLIDTSSFRIGQSKTEGINVNLIDTLGSYLTMVGSFYPNLESIVFLTI